MADGAGSASRDLDVDELLDVVDELLATNGTWTSVKFRPTRPAGAKARRRPQGGARTVEVGGRGGTGWRQRRPPAEGAGQRRRGAARSRPAPHPTSRLHSSAPTPTPRRPGTCILRLLSGSTAPMLGGTAALRRISGVNPGPAGEALRRRIRVSRARDFWSCKIRCERNRARADISRGRAPPTVPCQEVER